VPHTGLLTFIRDEPVAKEVGSVEIFVTHQPFISYRELLY
jgi:5,10-methenyltetrahydromethanopterin hydrogenase